MSLLKKNKMPEYDHTENGQLGYNISFCYDNHNYINIYQCVWHYIDGESYETNTASFCNIPVADIKKALIRHELEVRGINSHPGNYELQVVPSDNSAPTKMDALGLKNYTDLVVKLTRARDGLADVRRTFGERSEPALWADKRVSELKYLVDEAYKELTGQSEEGGTSE